MQITELNKLSKVLSVNTVDRIYVIIVEYELLTGIGVDL